MDLKLADNAALVTASSSGMGKGCARSLLAEGANVAICGRDPDRLEVAREELDATGPGQVLAVPTDLTDPDDVESLIEATVDAFGGLDHLVTSAGSPPGGSFASLDDDDWQFAFELRGLSVVRTLRAAHPHLAASDHGTVVTIAATATKETHSGLVISSSVRKAVVGLMKTLSFEWAPIRLNAVLAGAHDTPRLREHAQEGIDDGTYEDMEEALLGWASNPLGRVGQPREIGDVVAFLSSERAGYVNGTAIPVDGGRMKST